MSITVRSLLPKVKVFREDLEEDRSIYAIQETVRKICRQTGYAQQVVTASTVALTPTVNLASLVTNGAIYRVMLVRVYDTQMQSYKTLYEYNQSTIDNYEQYRDYSTGVITAWAYKGNSVIQVYPTPTGIDTLEVTVSYIPSGEIDTIPLPEECEEAVIAGALSMLMMQPGPGQNLALAKDREVLYNREIDFLKANALLGQSGRARAVGKVFAARAIRSYDTRWL